MNLNLTCIDQSLEGTPWVLSLDSDCVQLLDEDGNLATEFPRSEALSRILLPSFWESIAGMGIKMANGEYRWFEKERIQVTEIRDYLDRTLLLKSSTNLLPMRYGGFLFLGMGLLFVAVGIVITIILMMHFSDVQGGAPDDFTRYGAGLPVFLGLVSIYMGIKKMRTHARLIRLMTRRE